MSAMLWQDLCEIVILNKALKICFFLKHVTELVLGSQRTKSWGRERSKKAKCWGKYFLLGGGWCVCEVKHSGQMSSGNCSQLKFACTYRISSPYSTWEHCSIGHNLTQPLCSLFFKKTKSTKSVNPPRFRITLWVKILLPKYCPTSMLTCFSCLQ